MVFKYQVTLMISDKSYQRGRKLIKEALIEEVVFFLDKKNRLKYLV